jgi:hypothetical protein
MTSPESLPADELDPRLQPILEQYGNVPIFNHDGQPQLLAQAVNECPPFVNALLGAEGPEQLQQIVNALRAPE